MLKRLKSSRSKTVLAEAPPAEEQPLLDPTEDVEEAKPKLPFVIGAGLGRTGTSSLHAALDQLGYKTLHMRDILMQKFKNHEVWFEWAKAKRNKDENAHELAMAVVKEILDQGYTATVDFPACLLYEELMEAIPDSKVILSVRNTGEKWADSVLATIGAVGPIECNKAPAKFDPFYNSYYNTTYPYLWEEIGVFPLGKADCTKPLPRDALAKAHGDWNERVKATVPAEKLLVHTSADGFGPICELLGIPSPESPYPHLNDTGQFQAMLKMKQKAVDDYWAMIWTRVGIVSLVVIITAGVIVYFLM